MKLKFLVFTAVTFLAMLSFKNSDAFMFWNQACSFSGTSTSYVSVANSSSVNITGSFTLEAWISPVNSTSPAAQIISEKRTGLSSTGFTLFLSNGKVSLRTNSVVRLIGKTIVQNNVWTHIAGTYNSSSNLFTIFINGNLDTSSTVSNAAPVTNSDSLKIGRGNDLNPYKGLIDEFRLWNRALTGAEIFKNRRTSLGAGTGVYSNLVLSITFQDNESAGTDFSLIDWSNNGNNGNNNGVNSVDLSSRPSTTISPNESAVFDGVNDYLTGADNPAVSPTAAITIESWIYPRTITGNQIILYKGSPTGSSANYSLRLTGSNLNAVINGNNSFSSTSTIPANQWTHVSFAYDGATGKYAFYINGRKSGNGINLLGNIINGADSLYIGGTSASGNYFNGLIDEVRISNYVKTQFMINSFLFQSIDQANEPNSTLSNVVYNLDGYAYDNTENGPLLNFRGNAEFSNPGTIDNQPVSPIDRADENNFQKGFSIKSSNNRIPAAGNIGMISDSIEICFDTLMSDVNLYMALNHTAEEELSIFLIAPNGESVQVYMNQTLTTNADNIITIFDDQADSSLSNSVRYVSYSPKIKPANSMNSVFGGDRSAGKWKLIINDLTGSGNGRLYAWGIQFNNLTTNIPSLCMRVFMEGFYRSVDSCVTDTIKVHLRESTFPFLDVGVKGETPDDNFIGNYSYDGVPAAGDYYLQVEHRNSVEIWSADPVTFDFLSGSTLYDFTDAQSKAFGSNQVMVEAVPLRYAMYGGDTDQDDIVDGTDLAAVENDAAVALAGYVTSDLTGDDFVDASDIVIVEKNAGLSVQVITP